MEQNPYEAPSAIAAASGERTMARLPVASFLATSVLFYAINVLVIRRLGLRTAESLLYRCFKNAPAMPFFVAGGALVECAIPSHKKYLDMDLILGLLLTILGPMLWGIFAAYVTWRWNARCSQRRR